MDFLLFTLPQKQEFYLVKPDEGIENSVSFVPFVGEKNIDFFFKNIKTIDREGASRVLKQVKFSKLEKPTPSVDKSEYLDKIQRAIREIKTNGWQKLVISRQESHVFDELDLSETFFNLTENYPQALCYVWGNAGKLWVGATPELLGCYEKKTSIFKTMSLAGTLPLLEKWTGKEIEEQKAVTQYIADVLMRYADEVNISDVHEHVLGKIKHLKTDFQAKVNKNALYELIDELHPTPAVCGFPKEKCRATILEIENYDREYYSGYIKIEMTDKVYFFVNLRCMQLFENNAMLYVGGGITENSIPEKEWQETVLKSQTILDNLV